MMSVNNRKKEINRIVILAVFIAVIPACGGGGGSNNNASTGDATLDGLGYTGDTSQAEVTADNTEEFVGGFKVTTQDTPVMEREKPSPDPYDEIKLAMSALPAVNAALPSMELLFKTVNQSNTEDGAESGSVTVSTQMDTTLLRMTWMQTRYDNYDNVQDGESMTLDGTLSVTVTDYDSGGNFNGSGDYDIDLTLTAAAGTLVTKGTWTVVIDSNANTASYSDMNLLVSTSATGNEVVLKNFSATVIFTPEMIFPMGISYDYSGTLYHSEYGYVAFSTPEPLVLNIYTDGGNFSSGSMLIEGANGARALLTVNSSTQVTIQVDIDGDGSYDTDVTYSWDEL